MTFTFHRLALMAWIVICSSEAYPGTTPVVTTKQGRVAGTKELSEGGRPFFSYMGIPYAESPVNELRFKDPVPGRKWEGLLEATEMPEYCLQYTFLDMAFQNKTSIWPEGSEDCLYLNVFTPEGNESEKGLAVMVYIHGGGFYSGGAKEYPPHVLLDEDIVLVVLQYRLGVFGFLSTEDAVLPGNMGLKDQQLALKWVQENIAQFGGDPEAVTIFGESAGGASVHYQILSPGSKGLFGRAILQSGTALCPWASVRGHKAHASVMGDQVGCSLQEGSKSYLECMKRVDSYVLHELSLQSVEWGSSPLYVLPRVDGEFLPDYPETLLKEGRYNKVDLIVGKTRDEGALLMTSLRRKPHMMEKLQKQFGKFGPLSLKMFDQGEDSQELAEEVYYHYLNKRHIIFTSEDDPSLMKMFSDRYFGFCINAAAELHSSDDEMSVFLYQLTHEGESSLLNLVPEVRTHNWISHLDDMFYLFSGGPIFQQQLTNEDDLKLRRLILSLWTNFAKTGTPTPPPPFSLRWEEATTKDLKYLNLKLDPRMEKDNFKEERKFWSSLNTKQNERLYWSSSKKFPQNKKTEF